LHDTNVKVYENNTKKNLSNYLIKLSFKLKYINNNKMVHYFFDFKQ